MRSLSAALQYAWFGLDFFLLRRTRPYILGLVVTDRCNLSCQHCRIASNDGLAMPMTSIERHLQDFFKRGARFLYLEGGEPYLWRDGALQLKDVVARARAIGYLRVHVYTNGTVPLDAGEDFTWVSLDGLDDMHRKLRGIPVERVLRNVRQHRRPFAILTTINAQNYREIPEFLAFVAQELPGIGVTFFLHTPYYGIDRLFLSPAARLEAVELIHAAKRQRLPVRNSTAALRAMLTGRYPHPVTLWWVVDRNGAYPCCRAVGNAEVCRHCGYSTCVEIMLARDFHPGPIAALLGTY